jgi:hypothetical protein
MACASLAGSWRRSVGEEGTDHEHGAGEVVGGADAGGEGVLEGMEGAGGEDLAAPGELDAKLRGVDADLLGIDVTDPRQLYDGGKFPMHTRYGELDVFAADQTPGAPPYDALRARAIQVDLRGARLLIAHPEDLIRMKTAAASFRDRPDAKRRQDLDDIAVLERLRADRDAAPAKGLLNAARDDSRTSGSPTKREGSECPRSPRVSRERGEERKRR